KDDREAVAWYRRAAEQGLAATQNNLGAMYGSGRGVPMDFVKAYAWLSLAADQGFTSAVGVRKLLKLAMSSEKVAEAQKLAAELLNRIESSKSQQR
ncbi:MAG: sel1 repeat family protein, partial [Acidobacteria bacterium]|nr:sel1 repeat family protein [Acidobacteriota bacterium]